MLEGKDDSTVASIKADFERLQQRLKDKEDELNRLAEDHIKREESLKRIIE